MDRVKEYIRRKSVECKGYCPLSPGPPSSPSREKARYWKCVLVKKHQNRQRAHHHHHQRH